MSIEELTSIVRKLCVGAKGYPDTGGDGAMVKDINNSLSWNVRAVLHPLYVPSRASIRCIKRSTSRSSWTRRRRWRWCWRPLPALVWAQQIVRAEGRGPKRAHLHMKHICVL